MFDYQRDPERQRKNGNLKLVHPKKLQFYDVLVWFSGENIIFMELGDLIFRPTV